MPGTSLFGKVLAKFPARCRPALYFETLSNIGTGGYMTVFPISLVVLESLLAADLWYQMLLAMMFFGSNLLSPLVAYSGQRVPMRLLVIVPNILVAALLLFTLVPRSGPLLFTLLVGGSFVVRVFPRVAEMNMFRVLYPASHRSMAIGWTKAISAFSGLTITLLSWWWFAYRPDLYAWLYCLIAVQLCAAAWFYSRIPVQRHSIFLNPDPISPMRAFVAGSRVIFSDRRFLTYQMGFAAAGIANHMGLYLVPKILNEDVEVSATRVAFIVAVLPTALVIVSSPLWGRFLDSRTPMFGRGLFNTMQVAAFVLYGLGGLWSEFWPFVIGATLHAFSNGGGAINWLTGSMYFARRDQVSLYNGIHVFMTGLRGLIGPPLALFLFVGEQRINSFHFEGCDLGPFVFFVCASLSALGCLTMLVLHVTDTGPRDESYRHAS
ncbi:MAG: MFS transporter [Planctomycetaceae bacterium]